MRDKALDKEEKPKEFWNLGKELIPYLIGVMLGLPAIGILLPQLFEMVSLSGNQHFPIIFKIFSIFYFTIPFCALVILTIFQLKYSDGEKSRKHLTFFLFGVTGVIILYIILHLTHGDEYTEIAKTFFVFAGAFIVLAWYLYRYTEQLNHDSELHSNKSFFAIVQFSAMFLFFPIHWIISVFIILVINAEQNTFFAFICAGFYFAPVIIYWNNKKINEYLTKPHSEGKRAESKLSKFYIPYGMGFLGFILAALLIVFFLVSRDNKINNVENYNKLFKSTKSLQTIKKDTNTVNYYLKLIDLKMSNDTALAGDSIFSKMLVMMHKPGSFQISELDTNDRDLQGWTQDTLKQLRSKLELFKNYLKDKFESELLKAQLDQTAIAHLTQRKGIFIFTGMLIILLTFIVMIRSLDEKYKFKEQTEMRRISRVIQILFIVVTVLFIPLIKIVLPENIHPEKSGSIFQLPNWNLSFAVPFSFTNNVTVIDSSRFFDPHDSRNGPSEQISGNSIYILLGDSSRVFTNNLTDSSKSYINVSDSFSQSINGLLNLLINQPIKMHITNPIDIKLSQKNSTVLNIDKLVDTIQKKADTLNSRLKENKEALNDLNNSIKKMGRTAAIKDTAK